MTKYRIRRVEIGAAEFVDISAEQYAYLSQLTDGLLEIAGFEERFDLVIENLMDLERDLMEVTLQNMVFRSANFQDFQASRALFNRRIANLLSAFRTYHDHVSHHATCLDKHIHGLKEDLNMQRKNQYDSSLEYRVVEALRNYVQHRGFPVHSVTYHSNKKFDESGFSRIAFKTTPYLNPEMLSHDKKFKSNVLDEIRNVISYDLKFAIRRYIECLWNVHSTMRIRCGDKLREWTEARRSFCDQFKSIAPEKDDVGIAAVIQHENSKFEGIVYLGSNISNHIDFLMRKNGTLTNLAMRYSTSEH